MKYLILVLTFVSSFSYSINSCDQLEDSDKYKDEYLKGFKYLSVGYDDWLFRDVDLSSKFNLNSETLKEIKKINASFERLGILLIMVPIPPRAMVHPDMVTKEYAVKEARKNYQSYLKKLRNTGVDVPNMASLFKEQALPLFFKGDHHWNHRGAREVGKLVSHVIKNDKQYFKLDKYEFTTNQVSSKKVEGSLQKAYKKLCSKKLKKEAYKFYQTNSESLDLFGEVNNAIALVGTSNSKGKIDLNFSGFINHYTKLNVKNYALSGGGIKKSMNEFINLDKNEITSYRYVVWEYPVYNQINYPDFLNGISTKLSKF